MHQVSRPCPTYCGNPFPPEQTRSTRATGFAPVTVVGPYEEVMGHAGALVRHPDGLIEGVADPRSDGAAVGF